VAFSDANELAPAVLGIVNGSWTEEIAARIPDGTRVVVRTHSDGAGDDYAAKIVHSLSARCSLSRVAREAI
jgi:hypothetical protein